MFVYPSGQRRRLLPFQRTTPVSAHSFMGNSLLLLLLLSLFCFRSYLGRKKGILARRGRRSRVTQQRGPIPDRMSVGSSKRHSKSGRSKSKLFSYTLSSDVTSHIAPFSSQQARLDGAIPSLARRRKRRRRRRHDLLIEVLYFPPPPLFEMFVFVSTPK